VSGAPPQGAVFPAFLELIISLWLTTLAGIGMGLLVSALANNTDKAVSIIPIILIPQIILSGAIFNLSGPTKVLSYVTITKWSLDSLGTTADLNRIFLNSLSQNDEIGFIAGNCPYSGIFDGHDYADNPCSPNDDGTFGQRAVHLFTRWIILILMTSLFLYLTCFMQKRKDNVTLRN
jgi:ABC transport system ATP-binding/permease protein